MNQLTVDLQNTYDVLEKRDWCQGFFNSSDGKVCLDGAIRHALGYYDIHSHYILTDVTARHNAMAHALVEHFEEPISVCALDEENYVLDNVNQIWEWNDKPHRTVEDVKLLLKKTINDSLEES